MSQASPGREHLSGYASGRDFVDLRHTAPALLVVDMQRAFVDVGATAEIPEARGIVPPINRLVHLGRARAVPVVWLLTDYTPPLGGLTCERSHRVRDHKCLWRESPDFALFDGMTPPARGDHIVVKHTYDGFAHTGLEWLLRSLGVDSVVITGVSTEACCDTTARSAYCRGFRPVVVNDATAAAFGPGFQPLALRTLERYFARVATAAEVEAELAARSPVAVTGSDQATAGPDLQREEG